MRNVAPTPPSVDAADGPGPGIRPPIGPGNIGGASKDLVENSDPNLIEVTVYGIAAMYEKFSTKKPEAAKPVGQP